MTIRRTAVIGVTGTAVAVLLGLVAHGVPAQCIGDGNGDNEVTIDELVRAVDRALHGCQDDGICSQQPHRFPASGQTTSYGPGSDGEVRAGAALSYTDNGDGTITDNNTGLMWEKKDQSGGIHDMGNVYAWFGPSFNSTFIMDGTITTTFLAALNEGSGFAGHTDWRIPNVKELESLRNYQNHFPAVDAAFNTSCVAGCTVLTCSCTQSYFYWSSTTAQCSPLNAWLVDFESGFVDFSFKGLTDYVRAVRGGL